MTDKKSLKLYILAKLVQLIWCATVHCTFYNSLTSTHVQDLTQWRTLHKILRGGGGGTKVSTCLPKGFRCPFKALRYANLSEHGSIIVYVNCDIYYQTFIGLSKLFGGRPPPPPPGQVLELEIRIIFRFEIIHLL